MRIGGVRIAGYGAGRNEHMIVGIDLGTTNSLVAVWRGSGAATLIPNALGHNLTPSVVSIDDDGSVLVGLPARERLSTRPARTAATFKRFMGTSREIILADKSYRPEELSALVLRSLKRDAEVFLGETITQAVITVPAYFNDLQRRATQAAGALAGLEVVKLLTEPTAASLACGIDVGDADQLILVADIGGGTFDVSLLHCFEGVMEVRATAGDTWLGGEDFVTVIVNAFMEEVGSAAGLPPISDLAPIHGALRHQAELAKRRLSSAEEATITLAHAGRDISWTISRSSFERLSEPVLARIRMPIERALRDARVDPDSLSQVILAGGASRMPMFRRLIGRLFRRMPLQNLNPDEIVAQGAAIRAGLLMRNAELDEIVMTDVAPFTLGVEVTKEIARGERIDGIFLPIIERNTVIPASRSEILVNVFDNQTSIFLNVYQGEARQVKDNIALGKLVVRCPPAPAGKTRVDVRFTYDTNGLLEVEATVIATGQRQTLVIEGNPGALSQTEIAARLKKLASLKLHPREDAENQTLIARANRMYEQRLGRVRAAIGEALVEFLAALETQDPATIRLAQTDLRRLLDRHDDDLFL